MILATMLAVQTVGAAAPPPRTVGPMLPQVSSITATCPPSDDGDIVVCARTDDDQYRIRPLGPPPGGKPLPPMTAKLGNGTIDGHVEQKCVGGFCAPALMARFKVPF